jgi:hypothetical protein
MGGGALYIATMPVLHAPPPLWTAVFIYARRPGPLSASNLNGCFVSVREGGTLPTENIGHTRTTIDLGILEIPPLSIDQRNKQLIEQCKMLPKDRSLILWGYTHPPRPTGRLRRDSGGRRSCLEKEAESVGRLSSFSRKRSKKR